MAAIRPIAVANSASAMPGATTASEVFFEAAIDWKLDMMPQTVPNRPSMTAFTTQCAWMIRAISETSEDAIGRADFATSAGFIGGILSTLYLRFEPDLFGKPVPTFPDHAQSPV